LLRGVDSPVFTLGIFLRVRPLKVLKDHRTYEVLRVLTLLTNQYPEAPLHHSHLECLVNPPITQDPQQDRGPLPKLFMHNHRVNQCSHRTNPDINHKPVDFLRLLLTLHLRTLYQPEYSLYLSGVLLLNEQEASAFHFEQLDLLKGWGLCGGDSFEFEEG
jgi:hypothetical protein